MNSLEKISDATMKHRKDQYIFRIVAFLPALVVMGLIYYFSSLDATASSAESTRVVNVIIYILKQLSVVDMNSSETIQLAEQLTYPVRKIAHMTEYAVLAMTLFWGVYNWLCSNCCKVAWLVTVLYAVTDEIHQIYVPGRAGKLFDVVIDSFGAALGLVIVYSCLKIFRKMKRSKKIKTNTKIKKEYV